jgi:N-methylhydantoinase A
VIASAYLGETLGRPDILSFDMGGTTAKVGLIQGGQPSVTKNYNVGGHAGAGIGGHVAIRLPVRTPVVDLVEIGAGGGSIAWVDSGGLLRVGPQSAGADPGPVCYRRGGTEPTVTDANVVLGGSTRLLPRRRDRPRRRGRASAIEERCAKPLGLDVTEAANGIVEIANAAMVNALHLISVQRGYDPRDFVLFGFGGAGPVHANALARGRRDADAADPTEPGDLLRHRPAHDRPQARHGRDGDAPARRPGRRRGRGDLRRARAAGRGELERKVSRPTAMSFVRKIDLRYVGQSFELTIPPGTICSSASTPSTTARTGSARRRSRSSREPAADERRHDREAAAAAARRRRQGRAEEQRPVYFAESDGYVDCPIYDRYALPAGATFAGPAVVEEFDSTTVLHPGYVLLVDETGNLLIERGAA